MRVLKYTLLVLLLILVSIAGILTWLGASESGSRWLVDTATRLSPVSIEVTQLEGSLAEGLFAEHLVIDLPVARIDASGLALSWRPAGLLAGRIVLGQVSIAGLSVDVVPATEPADPNPNKLFWLQLPVDIRIVDGRIERLRIQQAQFESVRLDGAIGWGRLRVNSLSGQVAGIDIDLRGALSGAAPGELLAAAQWRYPELGFDGDARFAGNIDVLGVTGNVRLPDSVSVAGEIVDLFSGPAFTGAARWDEVRVPGGQPLLVRAGKAVLQSDFLATRFSAETQLQYADLPAMPLTGQAEVRVDGITIDAFKLEAFAGIVEGEGALSFRQGLTGELNVSAANLDLMEQWPELPVTLGLDSQLSFLAATDLDISVPSLQLIISDRLLSGQASGSVRAGQVTTVAASIQGDVNSLRADVRLQPALAGQVELDAPAIERLLPALRGQFSAAATLSGTLARPGIALQGQAQSAGFAAATLDRLELQLQLQPDASLEGTLQATQLNYADTEVGDLSMKLVGELENFAAALNLSGGSIDVEMTSDGGWDGQTLQTRLLSGRATPLELEPWVLDGTPLLSASAEQARMAAHCWIQNGARLCLGDGLFTSDVTQASFELQRFPLAAMAPLLPKDVTLDGIADANGQLLIDQAGTQGLLTWQQSGTILAYQVDTERVETRLDDVNLIVEADAAGASLNAVIRGDDGLQFRAAGTVASPYADSSALRGSLSGALPDVGLLWPWLLRVANSNKPQGNANIDLRLSGTLGDPVFAGGAYLRDGLVQLPATGVTYTDIEVAATSQGGANLQVIGQLRAGKGIGRITGVAGWSEREGLTSELTISGDNLATVRLPELRLLSSPQLQIRVEDGAIDVRGQVVIPEAEARIRELPPEAAPGSADVIVHAGEGGSELAVDEKRVTGDIEVILGDNVKFYGFGLESRLDGSLRLRQSPGGVLRGNGTVRIRDGFLNGYGKELRVDRGSLTFTGPLDDPVIDVQVSRESNYEGRRYTVGLRLYGNASNLRTTPFSRPAMSEQDVLAFLLLDRPASGSGEDADVTGALLAMGLGKMVPGESGRFGLDEISFEGSELNQTAVVAGKRISDKLYVRYVFGLFGQPGQFRIRYRIGRGFSLEATTGGTSQALDIIYLIER